MAWAAAGALVVVAAAGAAWYLSAARSQTAGEVDLGGLPSGVRRDALNVVVITLDTLRADHLSAYGSTLVKTPALDRLAGEGTRFAQAMSSAPLTLPAHSSIFTGRFPPEHGVRDNGGFFLNPEQTTLAEMLKAKGFATGGFIAAFVLDGKWGIDQGFDEYVDDFDISERRGRSMGNVQRPGNEVVDKALPWIDSVKDSRFFAWIHLYDPHTPYDPPEPYKTEYKGHPYRGEVAFTDAQVGRVVAFLEERGLLDKTIVAVLGDHGESLGDHGEESHGFFIYESVTHVPFIVRAPFSNDGRARGGRPCAHRRPDADDAGSRRRGRARRHVRQEPGAADDRRGRSNWASRATPRRMYPLHHFGWSDLRALRSGRYKLIDAPTARTVRHRGRPRRDDEHLQRAAHRRRRHGGPAAAKSRRRSSRPRRRPRPRTSIPKCASDWRRSATSGRSSRRRTIPRATARIRRTRSICST